jgi:hypothetical protein
MGVSRGRSRVSKGSGRVGLPRLDAELAQLAGDGGSGEMRVDLVEPFGAKALADVVDGGAGARSGKGEGTFDRRGAYHPANIGLCGAET